MDSQEIIQIIQKELDKTTDNKAEIKKLLIEPSMQTFENMNGNPQELWVVGKKDEYYIVYEESIRKYGLAFRNIVNLMVFLGADGSLSDAYETLISREEPTKKEMPDHKFNKRDGHSRRPHRK